MSSEFSLGGEIKPWTHCINGILDPRNPAIDHVGRPCLVGETRCSIADRSGVSFNGPDNVADDVEHGEDLPGVFWAPVESTKAKLQTTYPKQDPALHRDTGAERDQYKDDGSCAACYAPPWSDDCQVCRELEIGKRRPQIDLQASASARRKTESSQPPMQTHPCEHHEQAEGDEVYDL